MSKKHKFRLIPGRTRIEYDENKKEINRKDHKYSLSCAKDIFESSLLFQKPFISSDPYYEKGEVRHMHLAEYMGDIVLIVTTMREDETIRIISMRKAKKKERKIYFDNPPKFVIE
jgi:uncharacterized DUF497 family protein